MKNNNKGRLVLILVRNDAMDSVYEEIGICALAAYMRDRKYDVRLLAEHVDKLDYEDLKEYGPNLIGFTVYQINKNAVSKCIDKIKNILPDTKVSIGGIYATYAGEEFMQENPNIDFSIKGVGEETLYELTEHVVMGDNIFEEIDGLVFRKNGEIVQNKPRRINRKLDAYPFIARDFLHSQPFKVAKILGSRGCTANCSFCSNQLFYKGWYGRGIKNIIDEMAEIVNVHHINWIMFDDSSFEDPYNDLRRVWEFANAVKDSKIKVNYYFNIRADFYKKADPQLMSLLKESGLRAVGLGLESGNQKDLTLYNKKATIKDNYQIVRFMKQYGIYIYWGFMNFNPYTNIESLKQNLSFIKHIEAPFLFFSKVDLYRGTSLFEKVQKDQYILGQNSCGEYIYRFESEQIQMFSNYLFNTYKKLNDTHDRVFGSLENSIKIIPLFLLTKDANELSDMQNMLLNKTNEKYQKLKQKCNVIMFDWLESLLAAISQGATDFYKKASDSIIKLLFDTGLRSVEIGIEAANEQDLALYNKKTTVQDNEKIINQYGIISHLDFINFNPYSTIDSIKKNLDFLIRHNSMFNFYLTQ
ncbi:MAG: radical SAM protein [Clostridiales bacterium]|nr:radical SAM protein [Clostridiales bacterium]